MRCHFEAAMHLIPWYESDRIAGWLTIAGGLIFLASVTSSQRSVGRAPEESAIPSYDRVCTGLALLFQQGIASAQRVYKASV